MDRISKEAARRVLDDGASSLSSAFVWDSTPQGHDFWEEQYEDDALSTEGRAILESVAYGEPVAVADSNGKERGKFRVGDRVRVLSRRNAFGNALDDIEVGEVLTLTGVYKDVSESEWVAWATDEYPDAWIRSDDIELADAPLIIQSGRFYRTRDGRKVGPMEWDADGHFATDGWHYDASGECSYMGNGRCLPDEDYRLKHDIIAEWTDGPVADGNSSNIGNDYAYGISHATTGFTVPLEAPEFGGAESKFKVGDRLTKDGWEKSFEVTRIKDGYVYLADSYGHDWPYSIHDNELRLVAEATSGKDGEPELPIVCKDGKFYVRATHIVVENDNVPPASIADIVRRLEVLEDKQPTPIKKGDLVVFNRAALVTGINVDGRTVSVQTDGGNYSLPLAALRAA